MTRQTGGLFAPYRAFLGLPDIPAMIACAWLSRVPIAMNALAMLLYLRDTLGSFRQAGTIVGTFFVTLAVVAPLMGRLIDRIGPRIPASSAGALHLLAMVAMYIAGDSGLSPGWLICIAAACGGFAPPTTILTRTIWRHRFNDDKTRKIAYSIDSVMIEINFTVGPLLVAALVSAFSSRITFAVVIGISAVAILVFFASPILKYWKQEAPVERHLLGPLTDLRLVRLFGLSFGLTFCFGLLEVGYPAYAASLGWTAYGGILLAANALGSATGGFVYGVLHFRAPLERQFALALGIMSVPLFMHGLFDQYVLFALLAFLAGTLIAPALTAQTLLVTKLAPAKYATEAFTWSSTFIVAGLGMGTAIGGAVSEASFPKAPFILAGMITAGLSMLAIVSVARRPSDTASTAL